MFDFEAFLTGFWILIGLALILLAGRAALRHRTRPVGSDEPYPPPQPEPGPRAGLILLKDGREVTFINAQARHWLGVEEGLPGIEELDLNIRPSDRFLRICRHPEETILWLRGLSVHAESHPLSHAGSEGMLILLQAMAAKPDAPEPSETASAPTELAELARSLDLTLSAQHVVRTVLEELPRLLPADVTEITLWNASTQSLLPFREGAMSASEWAALNKVGSYRPQEGYSGWLFRHRKPLYIPDVDRQRGPLPKVDRSAFPFRSYIGVPLLFGRECLGTLELASYQPNRYHARDLPLLQTIAALTAAALQRAQEADRLHLRADALDRLAGAVQDLRYANQAGKISLASLAARALDANIAGLLAWDPHKRTLTPIHPFVGLPPRLVDRHLSVFVPEASLRQARWLEQPYWISNRVDEDSEVDTLGLRQFVLNAKVHNLLLASVAPAGRPVAVLLAANKAARETFELEDAHCAMVLGALLAPHLPKDLPPSPLQ